jgi:hypothetical protein
MNKFITLLATLFTIVTVVALTTPANASGFIWRNYDADPSFKTREAAMAYREIYFKDKVGWSGEVLEKAMEVTSHPGKIIPHGLKPGMHLETMMAGGNQLYHDVEVASSSSFGDGVDVEVWSFVVDKITYTIYLPVLCKNWSEQVFFPLADTTYVKPVNCELISAQVTEASAEIHVGVLGNDAIVDTKHCLAFQRPGERIWHKFNECPDNCKFIASAEALHKDLLQTTLIQTGPGMVYVRVPLEFGTLKSTHVTVFCKTTDESQSCGTVVVPMNFHKNDATIWESVQSIPVERRSIARLAWFKPIMSADGSMDCEPPSEAEYKRMFAALK